MTISHQSWLIIEKIIRLSSNVASTFLIARMLGTELFGLYSYVIGVITLILPIANMGLDAILLREFSQYPKLIPKLIRTAIILKIFGVVLAIITLITILNIFQAESSIFWYCIATGIVYLFGIINVTEHFFFATGKGKILAISTLNIHALSLLIKFYILKNFPSVESILVVYVLEVLAYNTVLGIMYYCSEKNIDRNRIYRADIQNLLKNTWPLLFSGFCISAYMRVDQLMIEYFLDLNQLGIYSVAVKISEAWYFLPAVIATAAAPDIYHAKKNDLTLYEIAVEKLIRRLIWLSLIVGVVIFIFAPLIVDYLAGKQYAGSVSVLRIHIFGGLFLSIGVAAGKWFIAENYGRGALYKALLGFFINISGNLVLIPIYGNLGAAYGTVAAHFFANIIYDFIDPRVRPLIKIKFRALVAAKNL